jgi:small nuclear ribonucleoprotein (snRNP)-like protein
MNIRSVILCFSLLLAAPLVARESTDVIVMKNGDRITCQIKGFSQGVLSVSPPYVIQTISVDWSQVARLESKQLFLVKVQDGTVYRGILNSVETPARHSIQGCLMSLLAGSPVFSRWLPRKAPHPSRSGR